MRTQTLTHSPFCLGQFIFPTPQAGDSMELIPLHFTANGLYSPIAMSLA